MKCTGCQLVYLAVVHAHSVLGEGASKGRWPSFPPPFTLCPCAASSKRLFLTSGLGPVEQSELVDLTDGGATAACDTFQGFPKVDYALTNTRGNGFSATRRQSPERRGTVSPLTGRPLVCGGNEYSVSNVYLECYEFDFASNTWSVSAASALSHGRWFPGAGSASVDGRWWVAGGSEAGLGGGVYFDSQLLGDDGVRWKGKFLFKLQLFTSSPR